jgi:hypothetical protein
MRIVVHVSKHYDWEQVPDDVVVTKAHYDRGLAMPGVNGGHRMRVERTNDTHNMTLLKEADIIGMIIYAYTENNKCGVILTRHEAVAHFLTRMTYPTQVHRSHMEHFEVEDDTGPDEAAFRAALAPHLVAKHGSAPGPNIEPGDLEEMVKAYMTPMEESDHADHLHAHFKVPKTDPAEVTRRQNLAKGVKP